MFLFPSPEWAGPCSLHPSPHIFPYPGRYQMLCWALWTQAEWVGGAPEGPLGPTGEQSVPQQACQGSPVWA